MNSSKNRTVEPVIKNGFSRLFDVNACQHEQNYETSLHRQLLSQPAFCRQEASSIAAALLSAVLLPATTTLARKPAE